MFEGTEKKFELTIADEGPKLRSLGEAFWQSVVERADAKILSRIASDACDAYLLSESSLFVWDRKALMITCGTTRLPRAAQRVIEKVGGASLTGFFYERKNELYPHRQPTSFVEDAVEIAEQIPGRAYQFGHKDEHHLNLFALEREGGASPDDGTVEVLMYGLDERVRRTFSDGPWDWRSSHLETHLSGAQVDDHVFKPAGYSLNAIEGDGYSTLHVSPNEVGSYASFETNRVRLDGLQAFVGDVVDVFKPRAFDVVVFDMQAPREPSFEGFDLRTHQARDLLSGYRAHFMSFHRPESGVQPPDELPLNRQETVR